MTAKRRKPVFERLKQGLEEGIAHAQGALTLRTVEVPEVPPEIDARWTSVLMASYTKSKLSAESGDPVDVMVRTELKSCVSRGLMPAL